MSEANQICFRAAQPGEAEALTGLCREAKRHWGYPEAWLDVWRGELTVSPEFIRRQGVGVAELAGAIVGCYGLRRDDDVWHLEHFWLRPAPIGRGLGRALFGEAVREARAGGATELLIKSDPNAEPFYRRMGAERVRVETYLLLGAIPRTVPHLRFGL